MRHLTTRMLMSLAILLVVNIGARQVHATPITFEFTGVWPDVILTNGPVQPGDKFRGTFFYDPAAAVISFHRNGGVSGEVTDYVFSPGGAGIELNVTTATSIVTFRGDASAMTAEVMNNFADEFSLPSDRFFLQSFPSALFPSFYERIVERIGIDIVDFDLTLVNNSALPTNLKIPSNGNALVDLQGGSTLSNLDYITVGVIQSLGIPTPHITTIDPPSGPVGTLVTITGANFSNTQGSSTVTFGATTATISSWSDTQIKVTVPSLSTDIYNVAVTTTAGNSNPITFFIIGATATNQQIFHRSYEFLSELDLENSLSQQSGLDVAEVGFNAAHTLAGPLQLAELHIRSENLINLGMDLFRIISILVKGGVDPLVPFGPLFVCPPNELICRIFNGKQKQFTASTNELFEFNLAYQVNVSDLGLFHGGDRYLLDSPIFSTQTFSIAEVISITPSGVITFSFEGVSVLTEISIQIDIKPGESPNSINPNSNGNTPIAILSTRFFDAVREVDRTSLTFGRTGDEHSLNFCNPNGEDVNRDGLLDLVCHFQTRATGFESGDTQGILKGESVDHILLHGVDSVRIVR